MSESKPHITDHALLRYAERAYGFPLEALRREMAEKAARAVAAARPIGGEYMIHFDDITFRCFDNRVVTVVTGDPERDHVG